MMAQTMQRQDVPKEGVLHTHLSAWGASQGLRIPKTVCSQMGIHIGDELLVTLQDDGSLVIRPSHESFHRTRRTTIGELFEGYAGDYRPHELEWGEPVGKEVW